ncbi:hydrogenase maturation protease [Salipaludibacillus keqinensis]|uniref:Hydrogenase maturation protease n=1 Tax=Salipaludibacillus keqinensis TaxID=2045207 RepID=A0A323TQN6_9BACI|nr:hydrogenase maturation protease [Salipaludibacillus keqinensis]PYZ94813.1 hydrogenase maturation protease [Salipaludibacillus keqinensis]
MEKILVLGIGNQLMMDDGIGICVVEELMKRQPTPEHIEYVIGESDIDYCLEQIERTPYVMIIDAIFSGTNPGDITIYQFSELHERQPLNISPHNLHLFNVLYQQRQRLKGCIIGIEPSEISFHFGLSQSLKEKLHTITDEVQATVNRRGGDQRDGSCG